MVCKFSGRKISSSCRFVMRSVLDGGVGWMSGGIVDRSRDSGVRDLDEEPEDMVGELSPDMIQLACAVRSMSRTRVDVVESDF